MASIEPMHRNKTSISYLLIHDHLNGTFNVAVNHSTLIEIT